MMERSKVIAKYRERIKKGFITKLTSEEQSFLIEAYIDDLKKLQTEEEIKARCQQEIALLEEGYSKKTVAKTRLNKYRRAIEEAVNQGKIKLTETNSRQYQYDKKIGTEKTGDKGYAHHHFGRIYMCYDNDTYIAFNQK